MAPVLAHLCGPRLSPESRGEDPGGVSLPPDIRAKALRASSSPVRSSEGGSPSTPWGVQTWGPRQRGGLPGLQSAGTLWASTMASVRCLQACKSSPDLCACSKATPPSANFFKDLR